MDRGAGRAGTKQSERTEGGRAHLHTLLDLAFKARVRLAELVALGAELCDLELLSEHALGGITESGEGAGRVGSLTDLCTASKICLNIYSIAGPPEACAAAVGFDALADMIVQATAEAEGVKRNRRRRGRRRR